MFRPAFRATLASSPARAAPGARAARRFLSTAPPHHKSRSWKSSAARWGLAGAAVYYYNTATVFAEEPAHVMHIPPETPREADAYPTVASISEQRRAQARSQAQTKATDASSTPATGTATATKPDAEQVAPGSPEALEEEAGEQGAFNEETGEINWDCPCLGGMAHGPCGEQFRAAFSCFVFSKEEPKGVDCIEHFKTMQDCFRQHPDVYGSELEDDEDAASPIESQEGQAGAAEPAAVHAVAKESSGVAESRTQTAEAAQTSASQNEDPVQVSRDELQQEQKAAKRAPGSGDTTEPWHDARGEKPNAG
ncbi:hypothetical protein BDY17DRAFT_304008 [Neohortaea acidophila]|uniref:Mitochondrial intermembrane space import and assembly protein 40 n=1 Tax=Neohortaea acidophila TaxID=245834 RepID=A0A6A6PHM1_9PEZI|nr:uncharacterized protein BDY17DRAFT_304008 [Neohortaea acidophila]KAF2479499.1 hypothetical protein BDY17DRAFT_304008 [Neohortaea acidophila]